MSSGGEADVEVDVMKGDEAVSSPAVRPTGHLFTLINKPNEGKITIKQSRPSHTETK